MDQLNLERCPHETCGKSNPTIQRLNSVVTSDYSGLDEYRWHIYKCNSCGGIISAKGYALAEQETTEALDIYPRIISISGHIPYKPANYLKQARDSLASPSGSILCSSIAIDLMLQECGLNQDTLDEKIKAAHSDHIITEKMADWAHHVRLDANGERHTNLEEDIPNSEEALNILDLAFAFAEYLYVLPAKVQQGYDDSSSSASESSG